MSTSFKPDRFDEAIAHIADQYGNVFQVLNESRNDWDEIATKAQQQAFYNTTRTADETPT